MIRLRILHQDDSFVAIDKPAGYHVHPPEDETHSIVYRSNAMAILRDQLGRYVYPVHRIDRATSGVVLYALTPEAASALSQQFAGREVQKTYLALVRGWTDENGIIDSPMRGNLEGTGPELPAMTRFQRLARFSVEKAVGKYSTARYSLVAAWPETGRLHQIRRHLRRISHPIVGDTIHGDGAHNRLFREIFGRQYLYLKAHRLEFRHPETGIQLTISSPWNRDWHRAFDWFGVCPWTPGPSGR